eukprot:3309673-Pyramimonas_sp.AAC.1
MKFEGEGEQQKRNFVFLDVLQDRIDYILKIDRRQNDLADAFKYAALCGVLNGEVTITVNMAQKDIKGFSKLIKHFKTYVYKSLKLMPRVSDPDFVQGKFDEEDDDGNFDGLVPLADTATTRGLAEE